MIKKKTKPIDVFASMKKILDLELNELCVVEAIELVKWDIEIKRIQAENAYLKTENDSERMINMILDEELILLKVDYDKLEAKPTIVRRALWAIGRGFK